MTRGLAITDSQRQSSDRWNLHGAIYLLSGTLVGRDSVPNADIYWGTRSVAAFGQQFKAYMSPPQQISRSMGFEPGAPGSFPEVRIPVRNLPFAHSESLVAAVTDDDFRWENATATLRVAYLRPGQELDDLVDADWTPLVFEGFLGPPDEVTLDGFILPLYNRGARRNQNLFWPQLPSPDTMSGGAIDRKDGGTMPPVIVGVPQDWIKVPTLNLGVRGFLSSGYDGGTTVLSFHTITEGPEDLTAGNAASTGNFQGDGTYGTGTGRASLQIHFLSPVYDVVSASFDNSLKEFTVEISPGLASGVPRGGYVQQWGAGFNPANPGATIPYASTSSGGGGYRHSWYWVVGNGFRTTAVFDTTARYGWLFPDGEVRPADPVTWPFRWAAVTQPALVLSEYGGRDLGGDGIGAVAPIFLSRGDRESPNAPVYYDPVETGALAAAVTAQPEFTNTVTAFGVNNYGTGSTHTGAGADDSANAWDGADNTWSVVNSSNSITVTFNAAPSPFVNGDTTASVLHLKVRISTGAGVNVTNGAALTYFTIPGGLATEVTEFTVAQASPRNFNQTLHFFSNAGGSAQIIEAWWEHSMSAEVPATRTQDVEVTGGGSGIAVGSVMEFAELVVQAPRYGSTLQVPQYEEGDSPPPPNNYYEAIPGLSGINDRYVIPYPNAVMRGLHSLLGPVEGAAAQQALDPGGATTINDSSYAAAAVRFIEENIRLGFVWTEQNRPSSWSELEQKIGEQSRSFMFYGVSGHEILFLENDYEAFPVLQTFRLPGCPGANTIGAGQPLFSRTLTTELTNIVGARWDPSFITGELRRAVEGRNEESIADIGTRKSDRGELQFDCHTPWDGNPSWTVPEAVSGIVQFYADRQAFAQTRFVFDTAWIAHGLDRGSIVRIAYAVSNNPPSYRTTIAEVESVEVSPINGDKFTIIARSVSKPQKGLDAVLTWADVFDSDDTWTERILQDYNTWSDYWSAP